MALSETITAGGALPTTALPRTARMRRLSKAEAAEEEEEEGEEGEEEEVAVVVVEEEEEEEKEAAASLSVVCSSRVAKGNERRITRAAPSVSSSVGSSSAPSSPTVRTDCTRRGRCTHTSPAVGAVVGAPSACARACPPRRCPPRRHKMRGDPP